MRAGRAGDGLLPAAGPQVGQGAWLAEWRVGCIAASALRAGLWAERGGRVLESQCQVKTVHPSLCCVCFRIRTHTLSSESYFCSQISVNAPASPVKMAGRVWKESTSTRASVLREGPGAAVSTRPRRVRSCTGLGEDVHCGWAMVKGHQMQAGQRVGSSSPCHIH